MNNNEEQQPAGGVDGYIERLENSIGSNRDTAGLGIMHVGPVIMGSVDAINGEDGKEVPEFVATNYELKQLAAYWAVERIEHDFDWFVYQCTGSGEWRWSAYIDRRLNRLAETLGSEAMRKVWDEAVATFRKRAKLTDEDWRVFTAGSDEEQEAWRKEAFEGEEARRAAAAITERSTGACQ